MSPEPICVIEEWAAHRSTSQSRSEPTANPERSGPPAATTPPPPPPWKSTELPGYDQDPGSLALTPLEDATGETVTVSLALDPGAVATSPNGMLLANDHTADRAPRDGYSLASICAAGFVSAAWIVTVVALRVSDTTEPVTADDDT